MLLGIAISVVCNVLMSWRAIRLVALVGFIAGVILCLCGIVDWVVFTDHYYRSRYI
jgi:hypothetical protein